MEASEISKNVIAGGSAGDAITSEDWIAFLKFLRNRKPPLSPSTCGGDDVIEFLRLRGSSGIVAHIRRLSASFTENGGNPKENPFYSAPVQTYLKSLLLLSTASEEQQDVAQLLAEIDFQNLGSKALSPAPDFVGRRMSPATPVTWTEELHDKFLKAVSTLGGYRRAAPEQILWLMNAPSLTRDHVISHLQDHRKGKCSLCHRNLFEVRDTADSEGEEYIPPFEPDVENIFDTLEIPSSSTSASLVELKSGIHEFSSQPPRVPSHGIPVEDTVLVIYCSDNQDEDETSFINYILEELHRLEVFPLTYNLTGTKTGIQGMLPRFRVGILIFSKNYAHSARCLDELARIMYYQKENGLVTIPVYFKVSPSDVRHEKGRFWETFLQLGNSVPVQQVRKWMAAISETTSVDGYKWIMGNQAILARAIVRDACERLYFEIRKNLIGVDLQVTRISSLLQCFQPSEVQVLGIWGMAGIGKTTIARKIFEKLAGKYDLSYFLQDFHLMCQMKGLSQLRDDFFSKILGDGKLSINACDAKPSFLRDRFSGKTVLVVLDDVSNATDAESLVGGFGWFCHGHKIILTSRNKQVLVQCKVKELYEIQKLSESESFRLCSQYTTMQTWEATSLAMELVNYASGIPLVLRVLGSSVQKHMNNVEQHLQGLRKHPPTEVQDAFRRSFDRLDENEKNIFLDLACFLRGENIDNVVQMLDGCGFFTDLGSCGLIDESLISLVGNRIEMPNVFQDMGRFIVCEENEEPGKRSRLWDANDIADVLTNSKGTEVIEGIFLDASDLTFCELSPTAFQSAYRLRLLKFYCSTSENQCKLHLPQGLCSLPDELRLLHWECYPLKSLPRDFNPKNLVELNMPYSNMEKLWKGTKNLEKLKKVRVSHSRQLTKIPRLSKASNLEHIDLEGCTSLVKVGSSIRCLDKLAFLNLKNCSHLRSLPATVHLKSLEVLNLSGCSELEDIEDFSPNLKELYLAGTAIREVPSSIGNHAKLVILDLENCRRLQHLPEEMNNLESLTTLKLSGCSNLKSLPNLDSLYLRGLQCLNLKKTTMEDPTIQGSRLDGTENLLDSLTSLFRPENPCMCLNYKAVEELLVPFKYKSIGLDVEPLSQWPTFKLFSQGKLPSSISHSLVSKLYALVSLFLGNACLLDIPEEIRLLPSLKALDLSRNSFSKLPQTIKWLSKLHSLRLRHCKNLRSLPELPQSLELLNAHGCMSLKSFDRSFVQFPRHYTFSNCFNLSPELVRKFLANALGKVETMATKHQQDFIKGPAFSICVPMSAGWKSSSYLGAGSSAVIQLTPSLRKTLLGFAVSVVVAFWDNYHNVVGLGIRCICSWKTKKGLSRRLERIFHCWSPTEAPKVQNNHMFVFCDVKMHLAAGEGNDPDILADLVFFEFYPVDEHNNLLDDSCTVRKCGVYVIKIPTEETSLSRKRPASTLDPGELSDAEDMAPPPKRARLHLRGVILSVLLEIRKRKREQILRRFT